MLYTKNDISTTGVNNNIITLEELGYYVPIQESLSSSFNFWIEVVSSKIDNEVNHIFRNNEYEGIYSFQSNNSIINKLYTDNFPITSIDSVQYRLSPFSEWQSYDLSKLEYHNNYIIFHYPIHSDYPNNIKINYKAGYEQNEIPSDVKEIAIEMVTEIFKESIIGGEGRLGVVSKTMVGNITTVFKDLSDRHKNHLLKYKKTW